MTIIRVVHEKNYTVSDNSITKDARISWKAKGIWLYAMSRPDDWVFNKSDLINQSTDSADSIDSGLKELENFGYMEREKLRNEDGTFAKANWIFYEVSQRGLKKSLPRRGFPHVDNPVLPSTEAKLNTETSSIPPPFQKRQQTMVGGGFFSLNYEKPSQGFSVSQKQHNIYHQTTITTTKCLDLVDISLKDKKRLTEMFSEETIEKSVSYVTRPGFKRKGTLDAAIFYYCKNPEHIVLSSEDLIEKKNQEYLEIKKVNTNIWGNFKNHFENCKIDYIDKIKERKDILEFKIGKGYSTIAFTQKNFTSELKQMLNMLKIPYI